MMLVSDMVLWWDLNFRKWVKYYDKYRIEFRNDSVNAWIKLTELGCDGLLTPEN